MELNMISYKLQDMQFFNKLDTAGQVQLENNFSYSVDYNKENTRCVARLYQCVKDKSEDENHKFFVSVELLGIFELTGTVTDEDKKDIHVQTYQQMFPYAELLTKQLCAAGGMANFVLLRQRMDRNKVSLNKKQ
jgi:preprotein translocase subunit SecB